MFKSSISLLKPGCALHTSCKLNAKPAKVLNKIMGGTKKKKYYVNNELPVLPSTAVSFGKSSLETKITGNPRRTNMLNKLYMRHITDIMASGQYSNELLGYGIEVNKVKVTPDYKILNVYWIAKESEKQGEIESLLWKNAGHLTHELASVMLLGKVPKINFVKDKNYFKISDVQNRLNKADFGDDFEATDIAHNMQSEIDIILSSLGSDVKAKLYELDKNQTKKDGAPDDLPPMSQNVLGLNHAEILNRVKKGMSSSKASHRMSGGEEWAQWSQFKSSQPVNENPVNFQSLQEQRKAFRAFLRQRQILQNKQHRLDKKWTADKEYLEEEAWERKVSGEAVGDEFDEQDFISEDFDECQDLQYESGQK